MTPTVFGGVVRVEAFIHGRGDPEFPGVPDERPVKPLRSDPHDGVRAAVQDLRLPDDLGVAAVLLLPKLIADDEDRVGVLSDILSLDEAAAENWPDPEYIKIVG